MNNTQENDSDIKQAESKALKINNLDELFLNLTDNPTGFENKDMKLQLSNIYQLFEEEFHDTFITHPVPLRNTDFYIFKEGSSLKAFVTPTNNFDFYLKSKGSMFRFFEKQKSINGEEKSGYIVPLDLIWDYFIGFSDNVEFEALTDSFKIFNDFCVKVKTVVDKLYFIPAVVLKPNLFKMVYKPLINTSQIGELNKEILNSDIKNYVIDENIKVSDIYENYFEYLIYSFLSVKSTRFKDSKTAFYFLKSQDYKRYFRSQDLGTNIQDWLDELHIGKYKIVPQVDITRICENKFCLTINALDTKTRKTVPITELGEQETIFGEPRSYVEQIIEKQICYALKYFPELEKLFEPENNYKLFIDLNEVYKIITQTNYYLQKARIDLKLPDGLDNIIVPRASINAKIKAARESDLYDVLRNNDQNSIKLEDILEFKYEIALGKERISAEEFAELSKDANGLIQYKNMYILIDPKMAEDLVNKVKVNKPKEITRLDLLHSSLSGQFKEYDFDYDEAFANIIKDLNKVEEINIPKNLTGNLRPYQENGFKWLYTNTSKGFGSCMADDMGLGKTIQVLSLILKLKEEKKLKAPVLVICPTTLLGNWKKEIETFAPSLSHSIYHGLDRHLDTSKDIVITTFAILRLDIEQIKDEKWGMIVVDEAQNIKNPETSQTQAIKSLKSNIKIAMTGTPVENRLTELWSIFDFINRGYLGSLKEFQKSYAIPIEKFKETSRADKLKLSISPFILRRVKTDKAIINDLPEKIVLDDYCYLTKTQAILYEKVLNELMGEISKIDGINRRGMIFKLITALKQICNHPYHYIKKGDKSKGLSGKCEKFISIADNILQNNEKTLVFTQYKEMGYILEEIIESELNVKPLFFHGSLNRAQRDTMLNEFSNNPDSNIMILSLKAGGTGLNLTEATNVIHYDLWWNPAVEDQATDRTYRIGQDKNVMVHRLITLGTFEEKINEMINNKKKLANLAVFEGEKVITELTDEEIYEIFSLSGG